MNVMKRLIMVVDDDTDLLATLGDFLRFEGYEVETVASGEEGIAKLKETGIVPDLIILDISMPGMGGIGFLKEMGALERVAKTPVLVFTARANMEKFFKEVEVAGFIAKPCNPVELVKEIKRIIDASRKEAVPAGETRALRTRKKLLLAEDEGGRRDTFIRVFTDAGFDVVAVSSGPEVVERTIVEKPDVLLLKLVMERMNGDAAAQVLGDIPSTQTIPVILYDETGSKPREGVLTDAGPGVRRLYRTGDTADLVQAVRGAVKTQ